MFQVGQIVEVKSVDELERDAVRTVSSSGYWYYNDPENDNNPCFTDRMAIYCGKRFTITKVKEYGNTHIYEGHGFPWNFTDFMLKPVGLTRAQWEPQVGEVVRIREWDDMVAEFGVYDDGDDDASIPCEFTFIDEMREYCGRSYTIREVSDDSSRVWFEEDSDGIGDYSISKDMIEPVEITFCIECEEYDQGDIGVFIKDLKIVC